jgi:hypothetical protein
MSVDPGGIPSTGGDGGSREISVAFAGRELPPITVTILGNGPLVSGRLSVDITAVIGG